jgi:putative nucleotidyltransferase with HDIG domain
MSTTTVPTSNEEATRIAKALDSLPTLPVVAMRIGEVIHSKNVSVQQVADILRTDPATSAKLLRLVNSPYFGVPGGISDVGRAIPFVGFNTLYQLVLSISVLDLLDARADGFDPRKLWMHSLTAATAARELAKELGHSDPGACFTAALLHDMGKIALAKIEPVKTAKVYESMIKDGLPMHEAEALHGLVPHDRIGSQLAKLWRFPASLATPIEQHHAVRRPEVRDRLAPQLRAATEIVAAADYVSQLCSQSFEADPMNAEDGDRDMFALFEQNGFSAAQLDKLKSRTNEQLERSRVFLSLLDSPPPAKSPTKPPSSPIARR